MTYHHHRHARALPQPTAGFLDSVVNVITTPARFVFGGGAKGGSEDACGQARDAVASQLDQQTEDLIRSWQPQNVYTLDDMQRMVDETMKLLTETVKACDQAMDPVLTYRATLQEAKIRLNHKQIEGHEFVQALITARAKQVRVVESTGFKRWVVNSLNKVSDATGHIAYMACIRPAFLTLVNGVRKVWAVAIAIGKAMVRVAIRVGEEILKIPDQVGELWKYTKWGGLAFLAYYAVKMTRKPKTNPARRRRR